MKTLLLTLLLFSAIANESTAASKGTEFEMPDNRAIIRLRAVMREQKNRADEVHKQRTERANTPKESYLIKSAIKRVQETVWFIDDVRYRTQLRFEAAGWLTAEELQGKYAERDFLHVLNRVKKWLAAIKDDSVKKYNYSQIVNWLVAFRTWADNEKELAVTLRKKVYDREIRAEKLRYYAEAQKLYMRTLEDINIAVFLSRKARELASMNSQWRIDASRDAAYAQAEAQFAAAMERERILYEQITAQESHWLTAVINTMEEYNALLSVIAAMGTRTK